MTSIGKVVKTQGNKGELRVLPYLDFFDHLKKLDFVYIQNKKLEVQGIRPHNQFIVLKLKGCDSIDSGKEFVGCSVEVPKSRIKELSKDQFYWHDILGLSVFDEEGNSYGQIEDIFPTGSNDVFVVKEKEKEILIPAIKDVIKEINLKEKKVIIHLIDGLIE